MSWRNCGRSRFTDAVPGELRASAVVGRGNELSAARAALASLNRGEGGVLLVSGEAGVGKSRLLREITQYADAVAAAVAGQGVVIGRLPLLRELVQTGQLVAPFSEGAASRRGYFIETSRRAAGNPDAQDFVRWLRAEAEAAQRG